MAAARKDQKIFVLDIETNERIDYDSILAAAKAIKIN